MSSDQFTPFLEKKYINLETYRKNGQAVKTPVRFVVDNGIIYVVTMSGTGKVKRLNHNNKVRIASCNFKGELKGEWIDGEAYFANESESMQAIKLRKEKYGLLGRLVSILALRKGKQIVLGVKF